MQPTNTPSLAVLQSRQRTAWWTQSRFGMFIHWGLYAIPGRDCWAYSVEQTPRATYEAYAERFDPDDFDPASWARAAKGAGMRYAVLTAKHHDGFCLFDSALTSFKSTNAPAGRDLVREFLDAFRAEGLRVGLYYSLLDWHHPDYPHFADRRHPQRGKAEFADATHDFGRYLAYMHGQVRELCSAYGRLDILWLDFSYDDMVGETWRADDLVAMVRQLQPGVIINNRLESHEGQVPSIARPDPSPCSGDFVTPERTVPPRPICNLAGELLPWESCITMNDSWGFNATDRNFKPARLLLRKLVECVSKGGNMLLNVGPDPRGRIPSDSLAILQEMGRWMHLNHASIVGCGVAAFPKPDWGWFTQQGNQLYAHLFEPSLGAHAIPVPADRIARVRLLATGAELKAYAPWNASDQAFAGHTFVTLGLDMPYLEQVCCRLPDETDTVLDIQLIPTPG